MAILQVRGIPDHLYNKLKKEAKRQKRSISQHALAMLERGLLNSEEAKTRRRRLVSKLSSLWKDIPTSMPDVLQMIQEDRNR